MTSSPSMIDVGAPRIAESGRRLRLGTTVRDRDGEREIFFEADAQYGKYFCAECSDPFFIPLMLHGMAQARSVRFDAPVSADLLYSWREALGGVVQAAMPSLTPVDVVAETAGAQVGSTVGGVGTGLSGGLDSLAVVASHIGQERSSAYRLTHLAFFNTGSHDPLHRGAASAQELFAKRVVRARACADEIGLPLVVVDSNLSDWVPGDFAQLHTFRDAAPVLALQKLFGTYLYASGIRVQDTAVGPSDSAYYDSISLPLLSTERLRFVSANRTLNSVQKAQLVSDFPPAWRHLNVCLYHEENCSVCEKCLRRMLAFDILGTLPRYSAVLSSALFAARREWYIGYVLACGNIKAHYRETRRRDAPAFLPLEARDGVSRGVVEEACRKQVPARPKARH